MKITDYCDAENLTLRVLYYPNQKNRWCASIDGGEVKDSPSAGFLASTHGNGVTPQAAVESYAQQISGKVLVLHAMTRLRREYAVPEFLEGM